MQNLQTLAAIAARKSVSPEILFSFLPRDILKFMGALSQNGQKIILRLTAKGVSVQTDNPKILMNADAVACIANNGDNIGLRLCREWGTTDFNDAMAAAAKGGYEAIVRLCRGWGATDFNGAVAAAAKGGHEAIVRLCHDWGATDFNKAMAAATIGGHEAIVRLCHEWGAGFINRGVLTKDEYHMYKRARACNKAFGPNATANCRPEDEAIVRVVKNGGVGYYNWVFRISAANCHKTILQLCREWGVTDFNGAMVAAAKNGHEDIIRLCIEWGATDFDLAMAGAAFNGKGAIVELFRKMGATDFNSFPPEFFCLKTKNTAKSTGVSAVLYRSFRVTRDPIRRERVNRAMVAAATGGQETIVRMCREWGATNFSKAIIGTTWGGCLNEDIMTLIDLGSTIEFDHAMIAAASGPRATIERLCFDWQKNAFDGNFVEIGSAELKT